MIKRIGILLATVAVLLGVGAVPAMAQADWACPTGEVVCLFAGPAGGAPSYDYWRLGGCFNLNAAWNDRPRAVANNTNERVHLNQDANCGGGGVWMDAHTHYAFLPAGWMSSLYFEGA